MSYIMDSMSGKRKMTEPDMRKFSKGRVENLVMLQKGLPTEKQREIQRKGSHCGNAEKGLYRSLRSIAREILTDDDKVEIVDSLLESYKKKKDLKSLELLFRILGEESEKPTTEVNAGGIVILPPKKELDG